MSINLHCEEFGLVQTPTWVTFMCLYKHDGKKDTWKNILHRYLLWYRHEFGPQNGTSIEEMEYAAESVDNYEKRLLKIAKKNKRLTFYAM